MTTTNLSRLAAVAGALLCLTAVGIGAFGAHALDELLTKNQYTDVFDLANRYQFYHGLGLLLLAALLRGRASDAQQNTVAWLMLAGTIVFCGSLYTLAISNTPWLGAITPIGGVLLILSWLYAIHLLWQSA